MKPIVLIILDGWGWSPEKRGNAILSAKTPTIDQIGESFPSGLLQSSGIAVGLPWTEAGNSEVGHTAIGTGQIVYQPMARINKSIQDKTFFQNNTLKEAVRHTRKFSSSLHLMGLLGTGSVHSYLDHIFALLEFTQQEKVEKVFLHIFLDGRDSPPQEGAQLIEDLLQNISDLKNIKLASVIGRKYAMDRDLRWEKTQKAYQLITENKGEPSKDVVHSIKQQYNKGISDETIEPITLGQETFKENDAIIFFNFREDSARQLSYAFLAPKKITSFIPKVFKNLFFATMTEYEKDLTDHIVFPQKTPKHILSEIISRAGKKQFKIAETEKYAHVTYFFNGGKEKAFPGETRKLINSQKVTDFTKAPQMKAKEISQELEKAIQSGQYDFLLANFANADMLAHTGDINAATKGVEFIDKVINEIKNIVLSTNGTLIITADHGNAEKMLNIKKGELLTSHSENPVPFYLINNDLENKKIDSQNAAEPVGILQDVTATILELLNLPIPQDMDSKSLLGRVK